MVASAAMSFSPRTSSSLKEEKEKEKREKKKKNKDTRKHNEREKEKKKRKTNTKMSTIKTIGVSPQICRIWEPRTSELAIFRGEYI